MQYILGFITSMLLVTLPCIASAGVKIGNIQFDERGKIVFANTTSGKIIFPDKTQQGTAILKGDKGDIGDKGDRGDKGDKGDPGQVDKATICKVYADEGITQPAFCAKKIIFLTSQKYDGNLGGLVGADSKCQGLADSAGLTGIFKAWLSDSTTSAKDRLVHHTGSYVRTDGAVVAINWVDLTDGWLKEPIMCDEYGSCAISDRETDNYVFSNTTGTGTSAYFLDIYYMSCSDWTNGTSGGLALTGYSSRIDLYWTFDRNTGTSCSMPTRVYCIQQ